MITLLGIFISVYAVRTWKINSLGNLDPEETMRIVIPAVLFLIVGIQMICTGFVTGLMKTKKGTER